MRHWLLGFMGVGALLGCGGSGGGGGSSSGNGVTSAVDIAWGARSREFSGPGSALSATITFAHARPNGSDLTFSVDRHADPAAYTQTYGAPDKVKTGVTSLKVVFHAQAGGAGDVVGTAQTDAIVRSDGTLANASGVNLGQILAVGTVKSVSIPAGQSVTVGEAKELSVSALDANDRIVAVTPGSISIQANSFYVQVSSGTAVTASAPFTFTAIATIDGISSPAQTIGASFAADSNFAYSSQLVSDLVYNPADGKLYGSVSENVAQNPSSIVAIDPTTGAITGSVQVSNLGSKIVLSRDGRTLYAQVNGGILPVALPALTPGTRIGFANGQFGGQFQALDFQEIPGSSGSLVVVLGSSGNAEQLAVFDGGIRRSQTVDNVLELSSSIVIAPDGVNVYGGGGYQTSNYQINPSGITRTSGSSNTRSNVTLLDGNRLYTVSGAVYDINSGAQIGQLPPLYGHTFGIAPTAGVAYTTPAAGNPTGSTYVVDDLTNFTQTSTGVVPGANTPEKLVPFGTRGLAIIDGVPMANGIFIVKDTSKSR